MRILAWLVVIALVLVAAFAAINWAVFMAPTALSLVAFDVYAPVGGIMLGTLVVLTALSLAFAASWRTKLLLESRRLSHELKAQRDLAERAEASRVADLGARIDTALRELKAANDALVASMADLQEKLVQRRGEPAART
jgi:hypothetical protein